MAKPLSPLLKQQREAMFEAVMRDDLPAVRALLSQGAPANATRGTKSLLARALELPTSDMARVLLEAGAPITAATHHASVLELVLKARFHDLLPLLADRGCCFTSPVSRFQEETAAGYAAREQDLGALKALVALGVDVLWAKPPSSERNQPAVPTVSAWLDTAGMAHVSLGHWLDGLTFLLSQPSVEEAQTHAARTLVTSMFNRRFKGDRQELLQRFRSSSWCTPQANGVLACWLLNHDQFDWAFSCIETVDPKVLGDLGPHTPYQKTPVGCFLPLVEAEHEHPRRLSKRLHQLDRLLTLGCPTDVSIWGEPLYVVAAQMRNLPSAAFQRLMPSLQTLTQPLGAEDEESARIKPHLKFWQEFPVFHYLIYFGQPAATTLVLTQYPELLDLRDPLGIPPLFRSLFPASKIPGEIVTSPLLPSLEAFWDAGSHWEEQDLKGNNLVHFLVVLSEHGFHPNDAEEVFQAVCSRNPKLFNQVNHAGEPAWNKLKNDPLWGKKPAVLASALAHQLEAHFPKETLRPTSKPSRL